jgi:hypothetical protein
MAQSRASCCWVLMAWAVSIARTLTDAVQWNQKNTCTRNECGFFQQERVCVVPSTGRSYNCRSHRALVFHVPVPVSLLSSRIDVGPVGLPGQAKRNKSDCVFAVRPPPTMPLSSKVINSNYNSMPLSTSKSTTIISGTPGPIPCGR